MKRFATLFAIFVIAVPLFAQFTTEWERCLRTGAAAGKPSWFGSGTERGLAYGNMGNGNRLYVVSRNGGNSIKVIDPADGSDVTPPTAFDLSSVSGGTFAINDIEMTSDNVLIAANMASSAFKLYVWTTEGGAPTAYSFTLPVVSGIRYGDKITVVGSWSAGTVEVWVAGAGVASVGAIQVLKTTDQGANWTTTQITLSGTYTNTVATAAVAPFGVGGSFYIVGNGAVPRKHDNSGAYIASSNMSGVTSSRSAIKAVTVDSKEFIAVASYRHDPNTTGNTYTRCFVYNVTTPSTTPIAYGVTPLLADSGATNIPNAVNGDVAIRDNGNGTITVFVLGTDQGIGAYTTNTSPLPVELVSFNAMVNGNNVQLSWQTATETNNAGFEIQKSVSSNQSSEKSWTSIGFVEGAGSSNSVKHYSFTDAVSAGTYSYRLKQIDRNGKFMYSNTVEVMMTQMPQSYSLMQNYPNPFNPTTSISFSVQATEHATVKVYDLLGREVATLFNGTAQSGETYNVQFNASGLASGMYLYVLQTQNNRVVKKMSLMK